MNFTVNHGVTKSVYFLDPDGNELEVYARAVWGFSTTP